MLEHIHDQNIWDTLRESDLPIVLYGMGNGADQIFSVLEKYQIKVSAIFASDGFVRGHSFRGYPVQTYRAVCEAYPDFLTVMSFAVHDRPTMERIRAMNRQHRVLSPTIPVAGSGLFTREFIQEHEAEFDQAFSLLADERSRQIYLDILRFKVSGNIEYLFRCETEKEEVYSQLLCLGSQETIVDLGAYDGDTIREILTATGGRYRQIYAFEPDSKNFQKLLRNTEHLERFQPFHLGAWNQQDTLSFQRQGGRNSRLGKGEILVEVDAVDNRIPGPITLLKMDIEGSESQALEGAKQTILRDRPKLYLCAYHRNEDMFQLPLQVHSYVPEYRFHFRHHPYIPAWESNFYANLNH